MFVAIDSLRFLKVLRVLRPLRAVRVEGLHVNNNKYQCTRFNFGCYISAGDQRIAQLIAPNEFCFFCWPVGTVDIFYYWSTIV